MTARQRIGALVGLEYEWDRADIIRETERRLKVYGRMELCDLCRRACKVPAVPGVSFACYQQVLIKSIKEGNDADCLDKVSALVGATAEVAPESLTD